MKIFFTLSLVLGLIFSQIDIPVSAAANWDTLNADIRTYEKRIQRYKKINNSSAKRWMKKIQTKLNGLIALRLVEKKKREVAKKVEAARIARFSNEEEKRHALKQRLLDARKKLMTQKIERAATEENNRRDLHSHISASLLPEPVSDSESDSENIVGAEYGKASYYADFFEGRNMATGIPFSNSRVNGVYYAAHREATFGTVFKVTNLANGKWVFVTVLDRGPYAQTELRIIDLPRDAFADISPISRGVINVKLEVIREDDY